MVTTESTRRRAGSIARRARGVACALVAAAFVAAPMAGAQRTGSTVPLRGSLGLNDSLIVSVLTMGQGREIFDRFGHIAIRVRHPVTGLDSAWNWGMYDFNSPNFLSRWLTGDTRYWMAGYPSPVFVDHYKREGRAVWEQVLDLDRTEADSLLTVLRWQARDENKFYRYDYYLDNCSTRVRDAIDAVLGGALKRAITGPGNSVTWRGETLRLTTSFPLIGFGMTFALGPMADAKISPWDELFVPMRLRDAIRDLTVARPLGVRPLVRGEEVLAPEGQFLEATAVPLFIPYAALFGVVLAAMIVTAAGSVRTNAGIRIGFAVVASLWHCVAGFAGMLVLGAGLFTRHLFMGANSNVLLGTPVSLALAVLIPMALSPRSSPKVRRSAAMLTVLTVVAGLAAIVTHLVPSFAPRDMSVIAFAVPIHIAIAVGMSQSVRDVRAAA